MKTPNMEDFKRREPVQYEYYTKTMELVKKHSLGFVQNPGGAAFNRWDSGYGSCQVPFYNHKEDYEILLKWLKDKGKEG